MQTHSEKRTDAAMPAHWTEERTAVQEHTGIPERIDVQAQTDAAKKTDAEQMPGTLGEPRSRPDWLDAPLDNPDVHDPRLSLDKMSEFPAALPACPHFAPADFHETTPDFEFHSMRKPARRKRQVPGLTVGWSPTVPNEMASALGSLSSARTRIRAISIIGGDAVIDSDCLASNHARPPGSPAAYPILQPAVWNPAGNRGAHPVVLPDDNSIVPLAVTYLTYLLFRRCAKRVAPECFFPGLTLAVVLQHREDLFGTGRRKRSTDRRRPCGARHHATRQSFRCCKTRCCKTDWN
jgi:hypothetical protein